MSYKCTGVVLAGGQSSRMGTDKAQLKRAGVSMLSFCQQLLADAGLSDICISRNVGDGIKDVIEKRGPLAGIYSAIKTVQNQAVLILPIDMPLLQAKDIIELIENGEKQNCPVCFDDCFLPLYLPVNAEVLAYLQKQLFNDGDLRVKALIKQFDGIMLPLQDKTNLVNTNTPQQWRQTQIKMTNRGHYGT